MTGYKRISKLFGEEKIYDCLEAAFDSRIKVFGYCKIKINDPLSNTQPLSKFFNEQDSNLRNDDFYSLAIKNEGFYELNQSILISLALEMPKEIGVTNEQFTEVEYLSILTLTPSFQCFISVGFDEDLLGIPVQPYKVSDLFIKSCDAEEMAKNLNGYNSKVESSTDQTKIDYDYGNAVAEENLKLRHEAIIHYLITAIENDAKNDNLNTNSQLLELVTKESKTFNKSALAAEIQDKTQYYFDQKTGFGFRTITQALTRIMNKK